MLHQPMVFDVTVRSHAPGRMPRHPAPAYAASVVPAAASASPTGGRSTGNVWPSDVTSVGVGKRCEKKNSRPGRPIFARMLSVISTRSGTQPGSGCSAAMVAIHSSLMSHIVSSDSVNSESATLSSCAK